MPNIVNRGFPATRLRRNRMSEFSRRLCCETTLRSDDLIFPIFVIPGQHQRQAISSMPGIERLSVDLLVETAQQAYDLGIPAIALFPVEDDSRRSTDACAAYDENGLIPTAIAAVKRHVPALGIITDIALDPYTSHGQDGLCNDAGEILNDETIAVLIKQALCHAHAGADIVAPSDMMDGRIGGIRQALEAAHLSKTQILAYSAKYASSFYGPFRDAVASLNRLGIADKKTYQLDPANSDEALHEVALDLNEGADMVMVKPALSYLDVITRVKQTFAVPTFAYQVSGEYALLRAAKDNPALDEQALVLETLLSIKRAGADAILSYYALEAARWLNTANARA